MKKQNNLSIKKNSKSFYFASLFLSRKVFVNCSILYSFCRNIDDIADKKIKFKKKKLNQIISDLKNNKDCIKKRKINDIYTMIDKKLIDKNYLLELINGVSLDTKKVHLINVKELIDYSYLVAGTVGIMMAKILGNKNIYAFKYAVDLGIAMQLTNIMRDILEDAEMDRIYLPKSWICLRPNQILKQSKENKKKLIKAVNKLNSLLSLYYESAYKGLGFLPIRSRFVVLLALLIYKQIAIKIIEKNFSNLNKREVVNIFEKFKCLIKASIIFLFNYKIHIKIYKHNLDLHKFIKKNRMFRKLDEM